MSAHDALATVFFALLACALLAWIGAAMRRSPYTPVESVLYFLIVLAVRILWRTDSPRRLPLPPGKGAVLIANHRSSVDPLFLQLAAGRPVHWMVAREYCEQPGLAWLLRICQVIPVSRGGIDTAATKAAVRLAAAGELVGMLPEGRINMTERLLLPARPGAVLVALRSGAPIIPCYIEGAPYAGTAWSPFLMPAKVVVRFGQPIDLSQQADRESDPQAVERFTLQCLAALARLAGRPDFQPELAGRRWKPTEEETAAAVARLKRRLKKA